MLICETRGDKFFNYSYDANGTLYAVSYKLNPNGQEFAYYYTHNWRGDIVGIYNGNGELRAKYAYDSWGNVTSITDGDGNAVTSPTHVGNLNPFRYRGYYMDTETGFYYLMSRYYDPVTHRFLNADGYFQTGLGILDANMNAYCKNNPINYIDPAGTLSYREMQLDLAYNRFNPKYTLEDVILAAKRESGYNYIASAEHHKRGTTNKANRQKHEDGQSRKKRDQKGEKGDKRRENRSNKRRTEYIVSTPENVIPIQDYKNKDIISEIPGIYNDFDLKGIPSTGDKSIFEKIWDDIVHMFD